MKKPVSKPSSEIVLYQTEDGQTRIECRFENETIWLSQKLIGELFQKDVRTINEHIQNVFAEGELQREATIRKFRIVQPEGARSVEREVDFYNLDAIISVGYLNHRERKEHKESLAFSSLRSLRSLRLNNHCRSRRAKTARSGEDRGRTGNREFEDFGNDMKNNQPQRTQRSQRVFKKKALSPLCDLCVLCG